MAEYLKMADLFDVDAKDFGVKFMTAMRDGHFVQDDDSDDSYANKLILNAVKHHDALVSMLEITGQALLDSCADVVNLKKEINRLKQENAEILDAIDESVSCGDIAAVSVVRKKYITD